VCELRSSLGKRFVALLELKGSGAHLSLQSIRQFAQFCFCSLTRGNFRFEFFDGFDGLVRGRREASHAFEQPLVLGNLR